MNLNSAIFPAPEPYEDYGILLWIPKTQDKKKKLDQQFDEFSREEEKTAQAHKKVQSAIPCFWLPYLEGSEGSDKILLYFHGNSEDIGRAYPFADSLKSQLKVKTFHQFQHLKRRFKVNVLCPEYPGYGPYVAEPSAEKILQDAEVLFDFIISETGILPQKILVFGRSIGSGPATYIASKRKPGALILLSPYTSIKDVAGNLVGKLFSSMVAERFRNIDEIQSVECPILFLHGEKDKVIPSSHTLELAKRCANPPQVELTGMTHDLDFNSLKEHVIEPITRFLDSKKLAVEPGKFYLFSKELFTKPQDGSTKKNKQTLASKIYAFFA